jgi:flagellin
VGKNLVSLSISTNSAALDAAASASLVNRSLETSMERLSTGKRINSASDDAAGVAISSRLTAEIRGTNQAIRNALDGQALISIGEAAHKEVENMLQRLRELAVQGANDTNTTTDRSNLTAEVAAITTEIDKANERNSWAGEALTYPNRSFTFQIGAGTSSDNIVTVSFDRLGGPALGIRPHYGDSFDLSSQTNSLAAIVSIDSAIEKINTKRSKLGAIQNRLNHTVNNLTNISANLSAARGGIEDTDFALETTELAKNQILQQASTAMLAQANASKQNVLGLLRS